MIGKIINNISDIYKVKYEKGCVECKARGKFKNDGIKPLVGDTVIFDIEKKIINEIRPRKNELVRPPISNVDQALIVISAKEPNLDLYLLDKMISIITFNNIDIIICFSKLDLLLKNEIQEIERYIKYYESIGYKVVKNTQIKELRKLLSNKTTVITGQSGVGKSTLLNLLDNELNLKTDNISHALGRGKHTTRHVELLEIEDALIADTPGFSSLSFYNMTKEDIKNSFVEFVKHKNECKYRDCSHLKEDNCIIKELVNNKKILQSRYDSYIKFIREKEDVHGKNIRFNIEPK